MKLVHYQECTFEAKSFIIYCVNLFREKVKLLSLETNSFHIILRTPVVQHDGVLGCILDRR